MSIGKLGEIFGSNTLAARFGITSALLTLALFMGTAAPARAAIIGLYVDARPTGGSINTTPSSAFTGSPSGSFTDGKWDQRTDHGLGTAGTVGAADQNVLEAGPPPTDTVAALTTSVTGLPSAGYDVYVLYWVFPGTFDWSVRAKLSTAASYVEYDQSGFGGRTAGFDTGIVDLINGGIKLYEAKIGTTAGGTSFNVNILNTTFTGGADRTWYDGVAYVEVPEPASLSLLAVGSILTLRRKRAAL